MNLKHLVERYKRNNNYDWALSECKPGKHSIKEMIKFAVYTWDPELKVCHRNYSKDNRVREEMVKKLQQSLSSLGTPATFEDILKWVYFNKVRGFNSTGVYDTALRIGVYFHLYPTMVYVHSGSLEGTKLLLGENYGDKVAYYFQNNENYPVFHRSSYPIELHELEPYHIENFLCANKERFKTTVLAN